MKSVMYGNLKELVVVICTVAFWVVYDLSNSLVHITEHNLGIWKLCAEHSNLLVQHFVILRNLSIDLLHTTPSIIIFLIAFGIRIVPVQQHTRCASQRQYPHADHPPHIHVIEVPYNMYHLIC